MLFKRGLRAGLAILQVAQATGVANCLSAQSCESCNQIALPAAGDLNFGCPVVFPSTGGSAQANHQNIPFGRQFLINYTVRAPSGVPGSAVVYLLMRPAGVNQFITLTPASSWCCTHPGAPCTVCLGGFYCASVQSSFWPSEFQFSIPNGTPPGDYELLMSKTSPVPLQNTYGLTPIVVTIPGALDVVAGAFSIDTTLSVAGGIVVGNVNLRNAGEISGVYTNEVYMSIDSAVNEADTHLLGSSFSSIGGGGPVVTRPYASSGVIPSSVQGIRFFKLKLDAFDVNVGNNWTSNTIQVNFSPDLRFADAQMQWQGPYASEAPSLPVMVDSESISFQLAFENIGNAYSSSQSAVEVYINDAQTQSGAALLGAIPLGAVEPLSGALLTPIVSVPTSGTLGYAIGSVSYLFFKIVDAGNEAVTTNNTSAYFQVIQGARVSLVSHKPALMDSAEPETPLGSMTWVNTDNDDGDDLWDFNPEAPALSDTDVLGGDNELVRVDLRIKPPIAASHLGNHLSLTCPEGSANIRVWSAVNKASEYSMGSPIEITEGPGGFQVEGDWLTRHLWVEGVASHPRGAQPSRLSLDYAPISVFGAPSSTTILVLGLTALTISGSENGYSPPLHQSDTLDQANIGGVSSLRVLPGGRWPDPSQWKDRVILRVELSQPPLWPVEVLLRAFDVDDPEADTAFVDPNDSGAQGDYEGTQAFPGLCSYDQDEDNRCTGFQHVENDANDERMPRAGFLTLPAGGRQDASGILVVTLTKLAFLKTARLQVSHQPGDNHRVVAGFDRSSLLALRNLDNRDHQAVVDDRIAVSSDSGRASAASIRLPIQFEYPAVTVWRILHMEIDSMQGQNVGGNRISAELAHFVGSSHAPTAIESPLYHELFIPKDQSRPFWDGSPDLDSTAHSGRFQRGRLLVGSNSMDIQANGGTNLQISAGALLPLPFVIRYFQTKHLGQPGGPETVRGNIVELVGQQDGSFAASIQVTSTSVSPLNWAKLVGGTMNIDGGSGTAIITADPTLASVGLASVRIPFEAVDDDDSSALPFDMQAQSLADLISLLQSALQPCCILPEVDGGNSSTNNRADLPFVSNASSATLDGSFRSQEFPEASLPSEPGADSFWHAYLGLAFQERGDDDCDVSDWDPDNDLQLIPGEAISMGATLANAYDASQHLFGPGADASWIFLETTRDFMLHRAGRSVDADQVKRVVAHEIGHQLGLSHRDQAGADLQYSLMKPAPLHLDDDFSELHRNLLRIRFVLVDDYQ